MMERPKVWVTKRKYPSGKYSYAVRWFDFASGKCHNQACGADKKLASHIASRKRTEIRDGIMGGTRSITWEDYTREHVGKLAGERQQQAVRRTMQQFGEACSPRGLAWVTFSMLEDFKQHLREIGAQPRTINRKLEELRAALNRAIQRQYIRRSPMSGVLFEQVDEPLPVVLTDDEKRRLLDACPNPTWRAFLFVLMTTGCRRGEILDLTWDRVDLDGGFITLTKTKGKRDRLQPLVAESVAMLREMLAGCEVVVTGGKAEPKEPCAFRAVRWNTNRTFNRIKADAGVPHAQMKAMRSTAASDAANSGFDVSQAGDFLGHADYRVTRKHYVRRDLENKRLIAEALASKLRSA